MPNSIFPLSESAQVSGDNSARAGTSSSDHSTQDPKRKDDDPLSIVLIGPDGSLREAVANALRGYPAMRVQVISGYPQRLSEATNTLDQQDVVIFDLDGDLEYALQCIEKISVKLPGTVMVFSAEATPDRLMRSMRAGAREFLTVPIDQNALREALIRAVARRPPRQPGKRTDGKLLTFMGAKGGVGVTTLASNFALALAEQRDKSTVLIDLAIPLGDVALGLGLQPEFSTINALESFDRLDSSLLSKLLVKHASGLMVLAGPGRFVPFQVTNESVTRLLTVARQSFDYVVVDAGSRLDLTEMSLFKDASTVYLVAQVGIAELRNSNRLISQSFKAPTPKVEIVLNRYDPRATAVPEDYIAKVLTRSVGWKIPSDYAALQQMQIGGTPLIPGDLPISRAIQEMARAVTGVPAPRKKKGFSLFG